MTEPGEPPQKLTRQERRHAEQKAAKRRSGDDLIAEDAEAYTAGAAYLATARTLYAQLSESVRRTAPLRRQVVRDASGTLDETWRSSFLVETQRWKSLTTQVQDLVPSVPVMDVHRRLQRCGAELIAAAEDVESAIATEDAALVEAVVDSITKANALQDDVDRSLHRVQKEIGRVQARLDRNKRA
jgi:hypothetical protein